MTRLPFSTDELRALADIACDSALSEDDVARLERLLSGNVAAQRFYLDWVYVDTWLRSQLGSPAQEEEPVPPPVALCSPSFQGTTGSLLSGWPVAYLVATAIVGIGLLIGAFTHVSPPIQTAFLPSPSGRGAGGEGRAAPDFPSPSIIGRITGMVDCRWEREGLGIRDWGLEKGSGVRVQGSETPRPKAQDPRPKTLVSLGDTFRLASGLLEITYNTGAKVILQGPVTYEVDSAAGGYLSVGKLTARVESTKYEVRSTKTEKVVSGQWSVVSKSEVPSPEPRAPSPSSNPQSLIPNPSLSTNHYPLFTIKTPTATVTDLGTEFGVEVDKRGHERVCVFAGKVLLCSKRGHGPRKMALTKGQEVQVDPAGRVSHQAANNAIPAASFVRQMPKSKSATVVSLADLVAGGNGLGNRSDWGIDPHDAHVVVQHFSDKVPSSGRYERYTGNPQIDGVFIPKGGSEPVQVDSAGHMFSLPKTCGRSCGPIWVTKGSEWMGQHANPRLVMRVHANVGITFDLRAIRAAAGQELARFRSVVAYRPQMEVFDRKLGADVWVLVDGQVRLQRARLRDEDGLVPIDLPLASANQFLTLIATDGADGNRSDHVQVLDPRIELKAVVGSETTSKDTP